MTTFTTQKNKNLPFATSAFVIAFLFLLQPGKLFAQTGKAMPVNSTLQMTQAEQAEDIKTQTTEDPQGIPELDESILNANAHVTMAPGNDNCSTALMAAYSLSPNANCKTGTMLASTKEVGETFGGAGCVANATLQSVWYSFIASQANMWVDVKQINSYCTLGNLGITVWRWLGTCPPTGAIVGCKGFQAYPLGIYGNAVYNILNMSTLVPGATYLVQISQRNTCAGIGADDFCVAVGTPSPCASCATACPGMCNVAGWTTCCNAAQVNQVTSTCPSYPMAPPMNQGDIRTNCYSFTAINDTLWLQQIVRSYCSPNTYSFTWNLYSSGCVGPIASGNVFAPPGDRITGLAVGTTYTICYTLSSACTWDSVVWPFAYTTATVLPVEMISFGAMPYKDKVKIYWTTASEENAKEFVIERTHNARDFTEIARVKASGNSTSLINYKSYDDNPLKGENYYRLKQIDFNGESTYSKLVSAKFLPSMPDLDIVPNPAKDKATIRFNSTGKYMAMLNVTDMQGKTVWSRQILSEEGINEYLLNMNELSKGIYSIRVLVDDQIMISKLVKE